MNNLDQIFYQIILFLFFENILLCNVFWSQSISSSPDCSQTPASLHPILSKFDILTPPLLICVGHMLMGMDHPLELTFLGPNTLRKNWHSLLEVISCQ